MQYQKNVPLFYWTKGTTVIFEEYNKNLYFHNIFPSLNSNPVFSISINVSASQPTPIPVNPPTNVQALLSDIKAKVSWKAPHLLGDQGKGAWQLWRYRLEVRDQLNQTRLYQNISNTNIFLDLVPNNSYTFRVAAYTEAGVGPWSGQFTGKSLAAHVNRSLIWSTSEGLFEGDVLGEQARLLVASVELQSEISDLAWFEQTVYMVLSNQVKAYNRETQELWTVLEIKGDSTVIQAIAIDYIGRRLYWSDSMQQTINRCRLDDGEHKETLNIVALAKELAVDSLRGFIYYSTDHAVEAYRAPYSKNKTSYYQREQYSGSMVVGLTLDMNNERVYWIVRGTEGSTLYSANMIKDWTTDITAVKMPLKETQLCGPLVHFSERLLWLKDDNTSAIADVTGRNVAQIESSNFGGIRAISVIDPTQLRSPPVGTGQVSVIPNSVNETSIRTIGTWSEFNITWAPVTNVNYGTVFYELHIRYVTANEGRDHQEPIVKQVSEANYEFKNDLLPPYTALEVKVQSYTYWASSRRLGSHYTLIYSPSGLPTAPLNLRAFVSHNHDHYRGTLNSTAYVRWNAPTKENGVLTHYVLVYCGPGEDCKSVQVDANVLQKVLENISHSGNYTIKVAAATEAGVGSFTDAITIQPKVENPLPRLLVGTADQIRKVDLDLKQSKAVVDRINQPPTHLVHISKEKRIFWTNDNEIWSSVQPNGTKTRLAALSTEPLSLTVDWVERILYWTTREGSRSVIYLLNLNKFEEFRAGPQVLLSADRVVIKEVLVSPLDRLLIWTQFNSAKGEEGEVMIYDLNDNKPKKFTEISGLNCGHKFSHTLLLDTSAQERELIWNEKEVLVASGLKNRGRRELNHTFTCDQRNHAMDSVRLYWTTEDAIEAKGISTGYSMELSKPNSLVSFYHQNYPNWNCLVPIQRPKNRKYVPVMEVQGINNITIRLPKPEMHIQCPKRLPTIKYVIYYSEVKGREIISKADTFPDCTSATCKMITSLDPIVIVTGLKAYSNYRFQVAIKSHYSEHNTKIPVALGPSTILSTAPGAPSSPNTVLTEVINPTAVKVSWNAPDQINSDSIYYVVHYEFEEKNSLNHRQIKSTIPEILLQNLNANLTYKIYVRAHSLAESYSESESVFVTTFPQPDGVIAVNITSTSITIGWAPQRIMRRYELIYEKTSVPGEKWLIYDSNNGNDLDKWSLGRTYFLGGLDPKTLYTFSVNVYYTTRDEAFTWTAGRFETDGGVPSPPGQPVMQKGFNIWWEPSKDNGAAIEEYSLEGYKTSSRRIGRRSTDVSAGSSTVSSLVGLNLVEERENITTDNVLIDGQWTVFYTGNNTYWFAADLTDDLYRFRVRSRNRFGYSLYSVTSDEMALGSVAAAQLTSKTILYFAAIIGAIFLVITICVCISELN